MNRWRRRLALAARGLAVGLLVVGLATLWALSGAPVPDQGLPPFDLDRVRELAGEGGPESLRTVEVSSGSQLGALLRAGGDWRHHDLPVHPVELVWPSGRSILIEPGTDSSCSQDFLPAHRFDARAYDRMQQAMLRADIIVATHEHFDHLCGLTRSPFFDELAGKAFLTRAQLESDTPMSGIDARIRELVRPVDLPNPMTISPGVVLIPVAGHTPGSLWIYVRTRGDREWLFVGDTLWTQEAIVNARPKPRLIAWVGGEDEERQGYLLRTLLTLSRQHPEVEIVVAHDQPTWERLLAEGAFEPL